MKLTPLLTLLFVVFLTTPCLGEASFANITFLGDDALGGYFGNFTELAGLEEDTFEGGGGNPVSKLSDPIIDYFNMQFNTEYGWILFYGLVVLFLSLFVVPVFGGFILSFITYLVGTYYDFEFTVLAMVAMLILGIILFWRFTHKSDRIRSLRRVVLILFLLFLLALGAIIVLNALNIPIPMFTAV